MQIACTVGYLISRISEIIWAGIEGDSLSGYN